MSFYRIIKLTQRQKLLKDKDWTLNWTNWDLLMTVAFNHNDHMFSNYFLAFSPWIGLASSIIKLKQGFKAIAGRPLEIQ